MSSFHLDTALATWRRSLSTNRTFSNDDLDELEQHLRDQIAELVKDGQSEKAAFDQAMATMGEYGAVEREYEKVYWEKLRRRGLLQNELSWKLLMFKNYLRTALRNLDRQRIPTAINIVGLAIGLACCLLITRYVLFEVSYDRFHTQADQIYRVVVEEQSPEGTTETLRGPNALPDLLTSTYPDVADASRLVQLWDGIFDAGGTQYRETTFFAADPSLFAVFDLTLVQGDAQTALATPNSLILTTVAATRYFGDRDPMGETLTFTYEGAYEFVVTGVMEPLPENSHVHFDFLTSFAHVEEIFGHAETQTWDYNFATTYLALRDDANAAALSAQLRDLLDQHFPEASNAHLHLQPLPGIHLYSNLPDEFETPGNLAYLYLFSGIGLLILLIACINFMNLATARSVNRAKEVGVRKVLGANRGDLVYQFLGEALLLTGTALVLAVGFAVLAMPAFNALVGRNLSLFGSQQALFALALVGVGLLVGVLAGSYPAFYLSAFQPNRVLKGVFGMGRRSLLLRKGLVVMQFTISIVLLAGILVMQKQFTFMQDKALGYEADELVYLTTPQRREPTNVPLYQSTLEAMPGVLQVTASSGVPGSGQPFNGRFETHAEGMAPDARAEVIPVFAEGNFAETMGFSFVAGRDFSLDFPSDSTQSLVVNEAAVRAWGLHDPVGKEVTLYRNGDALATLRIIGVVEDFHYASLHAPIQPMMFLYRRVHTRPYLIARLSAERLAETLAGLGEAWPTLAPEWPLELTFLNDTLDDMYVRDQQLARLMNLFTGLALIIACLGLFGLASFTAEQRTKEVGVRKVLGASVPNVAMLLSTDFLKLVGMAFVLAIPLAYFAMTRWLESFAYRVEIGPGVFVLTGVLALLVALLTVGYQSIKAALANPVKSLRYE